MHDDPTIGETAKDADWSDPIAIGKASVRVFFSPEPKGKRVSIDTVVDAVKAAKSSVVFCMFDPTDPALLNALLATSDDGRLLYGLLNSISDPNKKKKSKDEQDDDSDRAASGVAPMDPGAGTQVQVQLFNRSRKDHAVIAYDYFRPKNPPAGFLPEFAAVDLSSKSTLGQSQGSSSRPPPAVHIHHKFIVIDAETAKPTSTRAPRTSARTRRISTTRTCSRSPALRSWRRPISPSSCASTSITAPARSGHGRHPKGHRRNGGRTKQAFTLKMTRDDWVKQAYKDGTLDFLARTALAQPLGGATGRAGDGRVAAVTAARPALGSCPRPSTPRGGVEATACRLPERGVHLFRDGRHPTLPTYARRSRRRGHQTGCVSRTLALLSNDCRYENHLKPNNSVQPCNVDTCRELFRCPRENHWSMLLCLSTIMTNRSKHA